MDLSKISLQTCILLISRMVSVGRQFPWVSHISVCLVSRGTDCVHSRLSFQGCLRSEWFWKIKVLSPSGAKEQVYLLPIIKDSALLSWNANQCMCRCYLAPFMSPCGGWDSGNQCKKVLILWLLALMWVIKSVVSDSGVSCLLPACIKLRQAYC